MADRVCRRCLRVRHHQARGMCHTCYQTSLAYGHVDVPPYTGRTGIYNPDRDERIAELTRAKRTTAEIAAIVGVTTRTVARARNRTGTAQTRNPLLTADELAHTERLLDDGASYVEVARTIGRSPRAIRDAFPGRGWTRAQMAEHIAVARRMKGLTG